MKTGKISNKKIGKNNSVIVANSYRLVETEPVRSIPKINRNELCPCGSGFKYKKCCVNK